MMQRTEIVDVILGCLKDVLTDLDASAAAGPFAGDTPLIGTAAVLDSLGLVRLILEVEQRLADDHDLMVTLADERAMSQQRSPFRTVGSLADYIETLAKEQASGG